MLLLFFFFFNDTATTEIYTLSLHDALPILGEGIGLLSLLTKKSEISIIHYTGYMGRMYDISAEPFMYNKSLKQLKLIGLLQIAS